MYNFCLFFSFFYIVKFIFYIFLQLRTKIHIEMSRLTLIDREQTPQTLLVRLYNSCRFSIGPFSLLSCNSGSCTALVWFSIHLHRQKPWQHFVIHENSKLRLLQLHEKDHCNIFYNYMYTIR